MKRYQIFVSSTYIDLKAERAAVAESILKLRHIPVGMEQFTASNETQFNYIKRLIDETDYYILIIGNRYGSVADDGISYTEKEFDYAIEKSVPVLAFVHSDPDAFSVRNSDSTTKSKRLLTAFRKKVTPNRLVSLFSWDTPDSLAKEVVVALTNAFNDNPRPGWERITSYGNSELLNQINDLRIENDTLKEKLETSTESVDLSQHIVEFPWDSRLSLIGRSKWSDYSDIEIPISFTWIQIFSILGPLILGEVDSDIAGSNFCRAIFGDTEPYYRFSDSDFNHIVFSLIKCGAIKATYHNKNKYISLTKAGRQFLFEHSLPTDEITSPTLELVNKIKSQSSKEQRKLKSLIHDLSEFNSNPEATNYIGQTLISASVFVSESSLFSQEDSSILQTIIQDILAEASEDNRTKQGTFDVIFNLDKILKVVNILRKGLEA